MGFPTRKEREQAEAHRLARQTSTVTSTAENKAESSEILQKQPDKESESHQNIEHTPTSGEILPKEQELESITLQPGKISPKQQKKRAPRPSLPKLSKITQQKTQQLIDSTAVGEGLIVNLNGEDGQWDLPQVDTTEHYLNDNFSDIMQSSPLGSNISSLFNTTAFNTTNNEHKVTLDWVIPNGRNSHIETLQDKHIMDFPALGGKTGAMLVYLPDLEPFYDTKEFLIDLQSGKLFVKLCAKWHTAGLICRKQDFEVDQLMALIQHASIRLKNTLHRNEDTDVLVLDPAKTQPPPLLFIPDTGNYIAHDKPMSPAMWKNYIKDRAQAAVTYITEYGNTRLWTMENLVPDHKLKQRLQIVFGRTNALREVIDRAIECDDELQRKKCMRYLKPPKRFPMLEEMDNEETAAWISWIHQETHALLEDLNEEMSLQNDGDNLFTKNVVYATDTCHTSKISPKEYQQQMEDKLASPLSSNKAIAPLPQRVTNRHRKIPPINKENRDIRGKLPVYSVRNNNTRRQINYDNVPWEGNDTSYLQLPNVRQQTGLEQVSMNDTTDIRLCHRCGGEGHIRKYCNINVHFDFCKLYSHHTSVCRLYANFVRAHPMASSRRASPSHTNKQTDWTQPMTQVERTDIMRQQKYEETSSENDPTRRRDISEITRKLLE